MSGEKPLGTTAGEPGTRGATGETGAGATPYRLDFTGAMVAAAGASQVVQWATPAVGASDRIVAVRSGLPSSFGFTIAAPAKTIWLEVLNDNGDVIYQRAIDDAHFTPDPSVNGVGALPLVVGPYDGQGALPYTIQVRTDAASLGLVNPLNGIAWCELEIVTMAAAVTVSDVPVFP